MPDASFDSILGHDASVDMLRRMLDSQRLSPALLFHGPAGVGKATVAVAFSRALLCTTAGPRACGLCPSCHLVAHGQHPDLLLVSRLPKEDDDTDRLAPDDPNLDEGDLRSQILISQIRRLTSLAGLTPHEGSHRVFIVNPAERMNREAQNALLKTLEEPPGHSVLILVSAQPHLLLPTVRSRCFAVPFLAMRTKDLAHALTRRGGESGESARRAALAGGRPGRALLLDLPSLDQRRAELLSMLESLAEGPGALGKLAAFSSSLAGKDEATMDGGLELMQTLLRDALRAVGAGQTDPPLVHADLAPELRQLGRRLGLERTAGLVTSIERARRDLRTNVNRTLLAESLLAAVRGAPLP